MMPSLERYVNLDNNKTTNDRVKVKRRERPFSCVRVHFVISVTQTDTRRQALSFQISGHK